MYQNWMVVLLVCGTQNIATAHSTYGTLIHKIHGRALPHLDLVLLTMMPMMTSDEPSNIREISMTIPTVTTEIPQ